MSETARKALSGAVAATTIFENATTTIPATIPEKSGEALPAGGLESLVRILGMSGRRLVECEGEWRVLPRGDRRRRVLMVLTAGQVERLRTEKLIVASATGYVLASDRHVLQPEEGEPLAAGPWVFK